MTNRENRKKSEDDDALHLPSPPLEIGNANMSDLAISIGRILLLSGRAGVKLSCHGFVSSSRRARSAATL